MTLSYSSHEELFAEAIEAIGETLTEHAHYVRLTAAASTLLATQEDAVERMSEQEVLALCLHLGFELADHDEVRLIRQLVHTFLDLQNKHEEALAAQSFQCFEVLFYRDRRGQLMARFSMGDLVTDAVPLEESFEHKFAHSWHVALRKLLEWRQSEEK